MNRYLIIVPCYNEEKRLLTKEYLSFMDNPANDHFHFLFVNDGSSDNTADLLTDLANQSPHAKVLNLAKNGGKAEAIRQAVLANKDSDYDYIGFIDADLAIPLDELNHFVALKGETDYYLISAARVQLLGYSNIQKSLIRHLIGRTFATLVSNMLSLKVYDTQCGAKLYKREIIPIIFNDPFISKWLFDVEILFRMKQGIEAYHTKILEVPLRKCINPDGSKISISYFFKAPIDLLRIYFRHS